LAAGIPPHGTRTPLPNKKCENNPMHSSRPLSKQGLAQGEKNFGFTKFILTRRAKQWHDGIIAKIVSIRPARLRAAQRGCA